MDERYHSLLAAGIEKKYRQLEQDIMDDIVRRVRKARAITDSADWQIQRLMILGSSTQDIEGLIRKAVDGNEEEVRRLYAEVIDREYTRDRSLYEQVGKEFLPYEQNPELQQITNALIDQSSEELYNITKSMGFMLDNGHGSRVFTPLADVYNSYLDQAITGMTSGAYDYNTLIRRTVGQMTASGLRTAHAFSDGGNNYGVDYASGWHNRIDVAARRALLTGFGQLTGRVTDMNAQRLGTQYFEVTWHAGARPDHAAWQGQVYTKEQLTTKCGLGTGPGLLGWNCRHTYYPFIPGISERLYTDDWLAEQNAREATPKRFRGREYTTYEATQKQRQMETAMRARREQVQLLRDGEADPEDITTAQCKYQAQLDEYKRFSKAMGLPEQMERVYTGRTSGRVAPSLKVYQEYLHQLDTKRKDAMLRKEATSIDPKYAGERAARNAGGGGKGGLTPAGAGGRMVTAASYRQFESGDAANDFFYYDGEERGLLVKKRCKHDRWEKSLTEDENFAIGVYTGGGYFDINTYLRKTGDWEAINAEYVERQMKGLDSAIARYELKENVRVQRGVMNDVVDRLAEEHNVQSSLSELVGKKYREAAYSSTTVVHSNRTATAKPTVLEIEIPAGLGRGAYVNPLAGQFKDTEYEFLLKRGASFTIKEAREEEVMGEYHYFIKMVMDVE